ncbi:MAG TPA: hypothetical protein VNW47_17135 [Terriglobales bacterium]|nr:hypothetical protein [Terriglobales bacterium]
MGRFGSFDQADGEAKLAAEFFFAAGHFPAVTFVVVAAQVKDAVQSENLDFLGGGVSESARVVRCDFGGDGDVTGVARLEAGECGEGQYVGGLIFSPETVVEFFEFFVGRNQNVDGGAKSGSAASASYEAVERRLGQADYAFLQDDQGNPG